MLFQKKHLLAIAIVIAVIAANGLTLSRDRLASAAPPLALPEAKDAVKAEDRDLHQGTWLASSFVFDGVETPTEIVETISRIVEGDHVIWKRSRQNFAGTTVELDSSQNPKAIDVLPDGGPNRDQRVLGIYKFEGESLLICMAKPKGERPKAFDAPKGSGRTLMKFTKKPQNGAN